MSSRAISNNYRERIVMFMNNQNAFAGKIFFSTRSIADAIDVSVYIARNHLKELQLQKIVEPDHAGQGRHIRWRLT